MRLQDTILDAQKARKLLYVVLNILKLAIVWFFGAIQSRDLCGLSGLFSLEIFEPEKGNAFVAHEVDEFVCVEGYVDGALRK